MHTVSVKHNYICNVQICTNYMFRPFLVRPCFELLSGVFLRLFSGCTATCGRTCEPSVGVVGIIVG